MRSDNEELFSRFNDEQVKRSTRRVAKDCFEDGLREQSTTLALVLTNANLESSAAPDFGKDDEDDDDDDDDSIALFSASATLLKQKRRASDEEGRADLNGSCSEASANLTFLACLREEHSAEAKTCGTAAVLPGCTSSAQAMVDPNSSAIE